MSTVRAYTSLKSTRSLVRAFHARAIPIDHSLMVQTLPIEQGLRY